MRPSQRENVLDASVALIRERGPARITLEAIAEEAGMSKGGLLYHFASKEALLDAVADRMLAAWHDDLEQHFSTARSGVEIEDRRSAYARSLATCDATRAALALALASDERIGASLRAAWTTTTRAWLGEPGDLTPEQWAPVLEARGLWLSSALGVLPAAES